MTVATDDSERRDALRALLRQPLLTADGPHADELLLVRRHRAYLQRWCAEALGDRLVVEPQAARLFKAGLGRDPTRRLLKRNDRPFELTGREAPTPWDTGLATAMAGRGVAVHEEQVLARLVADWPATAGPAHGGAPG